MTSETSTEPAASGAVANLLAARALRDFGDGFVAVLLPVYLLALGFSRLRSGWSPLGSPWLALLTLGIGLIGARHDRQRLLLAGASLMIATGVAYSVVHDFALLLIVAALLGVGGCLLYSKIHGQPPPPSGEPAAALGPSRHIVYRLAALFSLDAFAGGFVVQSLLALWLLSTGRARCNPMSSSAAVRPLASVVRIVCPPKWIRARSRGPPSVSDAGGRLSSGKAALSAHRRPTRVSDLVLTSRTTHNGTSSVPGDWAGGFEGPGAARSRSRLRR